MPPKSSESLMFLFRRAEIELALPGFEPTTLHSVIFEDDYSSFQTRSGYLGLFQDIHVEDVPQRLVNVENPILESPLLKHPLYVASK